MGELGSSEIVIIYFVGTVGMILLVATIFFFFIVYQKRLLKKQLELNRVKSEQQEEIIRNTISVQEKERKRIARDLHDEVGAMLSVVKLNIGRIEKKTDSETSKQLTGETKLYLNEVITQVRRISRDLLPPSLEKLGLVNATEEMANWINKSGQIKIDVKTSGIPQRFEINRELSIFRIIQELFNNSIKHAEAKNIDIIFRFTLQNLSILISDNGKGFIKDEKLKTGLGLKNMESRAGIIDATFKLKSTVYKGTTAIISLSL